MNRNTILPFFYYNCSYFCSPTTFLSCTVSAILFPTTQCNLPRYYLGLWFNIRFLPHNIYHPNTHTTICNSYCQHDSFYHLQIELVRCTFVLRLHAFPFCLPVAVRAAQTFFFVTVATTCLHCTFCALRTTSPTAPHAATTCPCASTCRRPCRVRTPACQRYRATIADSLPPPPACCHRRRRRCSTYGYLHRGCHLLLRWLDITALCSAAVMPLPPFSSVLLTTLLRLRHGRIKLRDLPTACVVPAALPSYGRTHYYRCRLHLRSPPLPPDGFAWVHYCRAPCLPVALIIVCGCCLPPLPLCRLPLRFPHYLTWLDSAVVLLFFMFLLWTFPSHFPFLFPLHTYYLPPPHHHHYLTHLRYTHTHTHFPICHYNHITTADPFYLPPPAFYTHTHDYCFPPYLPATHHT